MPPHDPQDLMDHELASLSDPVFINQIVTSTPFLDWNLELAINGTQLSPEEGAREFLQSHPDYIVVSRDTNQNPLPPFVAPPPNLPDLWRAIENSDWHRNNEPEPRVAGFSVLRQMLVEQSDPTDIQTLWICGVPNPLQPSEICGQNFRRWDRGITHIRGKHLNHRPYPCHGECGVPTW